MNIKFLKKSLVIAALFSAISIQAQQVDFNSVQNGGAGNESSAFGVIKTAGGAPLSGSGFSAQLWGSTSSSNPNNFVLVATTDFSFNALLGAPFRGQIANGGQPIVPGASFGQTFFYDIRAWDNAGGSISTFSAATVKGQSALASIVLPANAQAQDLPKTDNFSSFALVPEPSVLALGLLGGAVLLFRRRK